MVSCTRLASREKREFPIQETFKQGDRGIGRLWDDQKGLWYQVESDAMSDLDVHTYGRSLINFFR